jgi:hypothetical protein
VRQANIPEGLQRDELADGLLHKWKELTRAGMKQQGLIVHDEVLIEAELSGGARDRDGCVDPIDAIRNFVDVRTRLCIRNHRQDPRMMGRARLNETSASALLHGYFTIPRRSAQL